MSEDNQEPQTEEVKYYNVQFRITGEEYKVANRLATILYRNGAIKTNSINAMIKACAFTQINLYLQMEARESAYKEREIQLEQERVALERKGIIKHTGNFIPNIGDY